MENIIDFESYKMNEAVSDMDIAAIGDTVARFIFPTYVKGTYQRNTRYEYGGEKEWANGEKEKGYTVDTYTLKIHGAWLLLNSLKYDKKNVSTFFTIIDKKLPHKANSLDYVTILVEKAIGISSKKTELHRISVWAGKDNEKNPLCAYAGLWGKEIKMDYVKRLKTQLNADAASKTEKDFITQVFTDWLSTSDMVKSIPVKNDKSSYDIGIGSGASTKVQHTIIKKYDFRKFVKKHGEQPLNDAMNDPRAAYYKKRFFKPIVNGLMTSDESWTDTYD